MDITTLFAPRAARVEDSGIRRISNLAHTIPGAINLSIGQPEFPVPEAIKRRAVEAILADHNGYSPNGGIQPLRAALARRLKADVGWTCAAPGVDAPAGAPGVIVTNGTGGGLALACMALLGPGDEMIVPDPYFVMYQALPAICDAKAVACDTYPDFRLTAERVERLMTPRTKAILLNSPGNPGGTVATEQDCRELLELARRRNILLISDEIYDEFAFSEARTQAWADGSRRACPSPCRLPGSAEQTLLIRGFGKTYGVTGWRLGYAAGPAKLIDQMVRFQQYTFVCPPTPLQHGALAALSTDVSKHVDVYERRRDAIVARLSRVTEIARPGGAFYAFPKVPERLKMTASQFVERCIAEKLLVIPGAVFSQRDTHLRMSFATDDASLEKGLEILVRLMS